MLYLRQGTGGTQNLVWAPSLHIERLSYLPQSILGAHRGPRLPLGPANGRALLVCKMPLSLERSHPIWKCLLGYRTFCKNILELFLREDRKMPLGMWMERPTPVAFVGPFTLLFTDAICTLLVPIPKYIQPASPSPPTTQLPPILPRPFQWTSQAPRL